jgi:excisionase family DNA binding protein
MKNLTVSEAAIRARVSKSLTGTNAEIGKDSPNTGGGGWGMLSVKQAAERLNVKESTIYAAVEQGLLRCYRIRTRPGSRGTIRISEEQLLDYLQGPQPGRKKLRHIR